MDSLGQYLVPTAVNRVWKHEIARSPKIGSSIPRTCGAQRAVALLSCDGSGALREVSKVVS